MAEKGYMFLLGLFLKNWGLKQSTIDESISSSLLDEERFF
jgi:hypothetical protein